MSWRKRLCTYTKAHLIEHECFQSQPGCLSFIFTLLDFLHDQQPVQWGAHERPLCVRDKIITNRCFEQIVTRFKHWLIQVLKPIDALIAKRFSHLQAKPFAFYYELRRHFIIFTIFILFSKLFITTVRLHPRILIVMNLDFSSILPAFIFATRVLIITRHFRMVENLNGSSTFFAVPRANSDSKPMTILPISLINDYYQSQLVWNQWIKHDNRYQCGICLARPA